MATSKRKKARNEGRIRGRREERKKVKKKRNEAVAVDTNNVSAVVSARSGKKETMHKEAKKLSASYSCSTQSYLTWCRISCIKFKSNALSRVYV